MFAEMFEKAKKAAGFEMALTPLCDIVSKDGQPQIPVYSVPAWSDCGLKEMKLK
jgi:hypothetical protein